MQHDLRGMRKEKFWECDVYKMFWKKYVSDEKQPFPRKDEVACCLSQFKCFLET